MTTLLVHLTIKPGKERLFEEAARRMYAASHTGEPGLRRYEYWRGEAPRSYYTLEAFDDANGFYRHQASSHHEGEADVWPDVIESIRYEWVDGVAGASPLAPTDTIPLPVDADDTMKAYAARTKIQVADWWAPLREA